MGEQYVGIDLRRRRSVIVRMTPEGQVLETVRIDNDPVALSLELARPAGSMTSGPALLAGVSTLAYGLVPSTSGRTEHHGHPRCIGAMPRTGNVCHGVAAEAVGPLSSSLPSSLSFGRGCGPGCPSHRRPPPHCRDGG
jgi:hypothetical protein